MAEPNEWEWLKAAEIVDDVRLFHIELSERKFLVDAILSALADVREQQAVICDGIANDHGGPYTDSGNVADECADAIRAAVR